MAERIIVKIDALGNPKIEAQGFKGSDCQIKTAPIENALASGGGPNTVELKPEWFQEKEEHVLA